MIVVGLDCAAPGLVFERYREAMPNVGALIDSGTWGALRSSAPPITVPAWTCMMSGRDPGELGLYGFRNRVPGETGLRLANGGDVHVKRVWDWLGDHGHTVAPLFVPLTCPAPAVRGVAISGFLSTGDRSSWTFPESLAPELEARFGPYLADVEDFRTTDYSRVFRDLENMVLQHFAIAAYVWKTRRPSFMMMVEIGVDRLHHAFWHHMDPAHPEHDPTSPWVDAGVRFYSLLDAEIGKLRELAGGRVPFMVVSDHGAKSMLGGVCLNDWLIDSGHLVLHEPADEIRPLVHENIDWSRTRAWAEGGYYGRVFLNVAGREPEGIVPPDAVPAMKRALAAELATLTTEDRRPVRVEVQDPSTHYRTTRGFPPDLMVYFDDLSLRALGSVGHPHLVARSNDRGHDTCNHDWQGIFVLGGGDMPARGQVSGAEIYDVTPTILGAFGIARPPGILGRDWTDDRE